MGPDIGSGDNRWQGYSHRQLYDMLHSGPGPAAAGVTADRWSTMAGALSEIQQDISSGITASGASWVGIAGDAARAALNPLGDWAQQASTAADVMRISAELQGDLLSKARAAMPAPVPLPVKPNPVSQLVTAQVDYEVAEFARHAAEQQAFQVMAQYEAGTTDNTSTLGEFEQPPALRVDTTPITGAVVRGRPRVTRSPHRPPTATGRAGGAVQESPAGTARTSSRAIPTAPVEESVGTARTAGLRPATESVTEVPPTTESTHSAPPVAATEAPPAPSVTHPSGSAATQPSGSTTPSSAEATATSSAGPPAGQPTGSSRDRTDNSAPSTPRLGGAVVPAARRADRDDEPDEEHESKYLIVAEDIYGDRQSYSPPVIGEHRSHR